MSTSVKLVRLHLYDVCLGFIANRHVSEDELDNPNLDMPPLFTGHSSIENEQVITRKSLYRMYEIVKPGVSEDRFNRLFKIYNLDKLFMEIKNTSYHAHNIGSKHNVTPAIQLATEHLRSPFIIKSVGCIVHQLGNSYRFCSTFLVCKWIHAVLVHCCPYFKIKFNRFHVELPIFEGWAEPIKENYFVPRYTDNMDKSVYCINIQPKLSTFENILRFMYAENTFDPCGRNDIRI